MLQLSHLSLPEKDPSSGVWPNRVLEPRRFGDDAVFLESDVVCQDNVGHHRLELIDREEPTRAGRKTPIKLCNRDKKLNTGNVPSVSSMSERHKLIARVHKLILHMLSLLFTQIRETPGLEQLRVLVELAVVVHGTRSNGYERSGGKERAIAQGVVFHNFTAHSH